MTNAVHTDISETIFDIILPGIAEYHIEIERIYRHTDPAKVEVREGSEALLQFNGSYALDCAPGAFFAIDANLHVKDGSATPITDISFLISLDGKTSARFPFTGTFDGSTLQQSGAAEASLSLDLQLVHAAADQATTASVSGTVGLPGGAVTQVTGVTYNNLIPCSVFEGVFYPASFAGASPSHVATQSPVVRIGPDYRLSYDYGSGDGELKPVPTYTYNLNMYYFSFGPAAEAMSLIMGTAAGQGLACNNMYVDSTGLMSRSLTTIPDAAKPTNQPDNANAEQLAAYSGYYQLPGVANGAFLAIQGEYLIAQGSITGWQVQISVSTDGIASQTVNFDQTMSFSDNRLTVPDLVDVRFTRGYDSATGTLVSVSGTIAGTEADGFTYFNPVPLSAFGGVPLTNDGGDTLTIESESQISYNGNGLIDGIYVPTMYILAGRTAADAFMMSFGTAGLKGNACIIMPASGAGLGSRMVYAIPNAGS